MCQLVKSRQKLTESARAYYHLELQEEKIQLMVEDNPRMDFFVEKYFPILEA